MQISFEKVTYTASHTGIEGIRSVEQLSFSLDKPGLTGIIGDRDSGKSSVLYLLSGLLRPEKGQICIDGVDINRKSHDGTKASCAFVMSNTDKAFYEISVERELGHAACLTGLEADEKGELIASALSRVGLDFKEIADIAPAALSRTMRYRLALAAALLSKPDILLLDEPFSQLDAAGSRFLKAIVEDMKAEGCCVICAVNDVSFLAEYADYLLVMKNGRLIRSGNAKSIFNDYYDLIRNHVPVPEVKKTARRLLEMGVNMPSNVFEYEQLVDRLKIIMWRKGK